MLQPGHLPKWLAASALAAVMGLWSASAQAVFVDCGAGGSVDFEINTNGENFIEFTGICNERGREWGFRSSGSPPWGFEGGGRKT